MWLLWGNSNETLPVHMFYNQLQVELGRRLAHRHSTPYFFLPIKSTRHECGAFRVLELFETFCDRLLGNKWVTACPNSNSHHFARIVIFHWQQYRKLRHSQSATQFVLCFLTAWFIFSRNICELQETFVYPCKFWTVGMFYVTYFMLP